MAIQQDMYLRDILSRLSNVARGAMRFKCFCMVCIKPNRSIMTKRYRPVPSLSSKYDPMWKIRLQFIISQRFVAGLCKVIAHWLSALIRGATRGGIKQATESIPLFNGVGRFYGEGN